MLRPWHSFFLGNETRQLAARVCMFSRVKRRHLGARRFHVVCRVASMEDRHVALLKMAALAEIYSSQLLDASAAFWLDPRVGCFDGAGVLWNVSTFAGVAFSHLE